MWMQQSKASQTNTVTQIWPVLNLSQQGQQITHLHNVHKILLKEQSEHKNNLISSSILK